MRQNWSLVRCWAKASSRYDRASQLDDTELHECSSAKTELQIWMERKENSMMEHRLGYSGNIYSVQVFASPLIDEERVQDLMMGFVMQDGGGSQ